MTKPVTLDQVKNLLNTLEINIKKELTLEISKKLEEKMTDVLNTSIEMKEPKHLVDSVDAILEGVNNLKKEVAAVKESQDFLSKKYEDMRQEIAEMKDGNKENQIKIVKIDERTKDLQEIIEVQKITIANLEQYGRKSNLEFQGIPVQPNENTNEVIRKLLTKVNIQLNDNDVCVSHRLPATSPNFPPTIIMRFTNREKRNAIYAKRRHFQKVKIFDIPKMEHLYIHENLTKKRRILFMLAKKLKIENGYQFLWTSKSLKIQSQEDLQKIR